MAYDKLTLDGVTMTGPVDGAVAGAGVKLLDTTITAIAIGVVSGRGSLLDGPCTKGSVLLRRSSVTGASMAVCDGSDPAQNCFDITSCKPPKLAQSTCNTSCQAGTGAPCSTWGVCAAD